MSGALRFFGVVFILAGILGGIVLASSVDWNKYDAAKEVSIKLWDNEFAQAEYDKQRSAVALGIGGAVAVGVSGVVSGIIFMAMAQGLDILKEISVNTKALREATQQAAASSQQGT